MEEVQLSYWERDRWYAPCDVMVVGGGTVGLHAAIRLKECDPNLKVTLVERHPVALGASTRNAGFACFGSVSEILSDMASHGSDEVLELIEMRIRGLQKLRKRFGDKPLGYRQAGGYELFLNDDPHAWERCRDELSGLNKMLTPITGETETFHIADDEIESLGFKGIGHLIYTGAEGQLHPGRMVELLQYEARHLGVNILSGHRITDIQDDVTGAICELDGGIHVRAGVCILAVNAFAGRFLDDLDLLPARNQVYVCQPANSVKWQGNFHFKEGYVYFRNLNGGLLIGGARHIDMEREATPEFGETDRIRDYLMNFVGSHILPEQVFKITHSWSGIMGVGSAKRPIIEKRNDHLILALRLGGMGVAIGSLVGEQAANLCLGK